MRTRDHRSLFRIPAAEQQNVGKFDLLHAEPLSPRINLLRREKERGAVEATTGVRMVGGIYSPT